MSSISRRLDFFKCSLTNLSAALSQRQFSIILSDIDTDFSYYKLIQNYEFSHNTFLPIIQICNQIDTSELRKKHLLTVNKDPNTKLRIKALKEGAADAISYPFNIQELFSRISRIADRVELFYDNVKRILVQQNARLKIEYIQVDAGFDIGPNWTVADYDQYLCSTTGIQVELTSKERLILKALVEADSEPITKKQLSDYLTNRHESHNINSLAVLIGLLNKKLENNAVDYNISRVSSYGYILIKK